MTSMRIRRVAVGLVLGLAVAALQLVLVTQSAMLTTERALADAYAISIADLGGPVRLLVAGALLGVTYALIFRPAPGGHADNVMSGMVLGVVGWVLFALNLFPLLKGSPPMWQIEFAADIFPKLIAYVLQGSLIGLIYGLICYRIGLFQPQSQPAQPDSVTNVVIIGGGYAGVSAAQSMDKAWANAPEFQVWLISEHNYLVHTPMLSEVSSSAVTPQNISPPLRAFFKRVRVISGEVTAVDWTANKITLKPDHRYPHREIPFDMLVVAAGGVPNFFGNRDVEAHTLTFKSLSDSMALRNQMIEMFERADFESDPVAKRRMLTFAVVGGGFAGVELIGGLNDFGRGMLPYYPNVRADDMRFVLIHTRDTILPELSEELGRLAQEKMAARGVEFILNSRVTGAEPGAVILGDEKILAETVVWTAGNRPSPVVDLLGVELTRRGQIPVTATMCSSERPELWAAGDCAQIPVPDVEGQFYPPTAQHALREGKLLGQNVVAASRGEAPQPFVYKSVGSLAALGHQLAVAEIFGMRFSGFLAWLMWRGIYLAKLPNLDKRLRVLFEWILDVFFPPDIVQTIDFGDPSSTRDRSEVRP